MPRPSQSALGFPATQPERIRAPDDLSSAEKSLFISIVAGCPARHFRVTDAPLVTSFVRAVLAEKEAADHLESEGKVVDGKVNAWFSILMQAQKQVLAMARALRLSPLSRTPLHQGTLGKKEDRPLSYYDEMRLRDVEEDDGRADHI
jgi:phage terminase small subunit